MNEGEVAGLYAEALEIQQVQEAKTTLNLKNGAMVCDNLSLPLSSGACSIVWESDNTKALENDGTVHFQDKSVSVKLTAVIKSGSYSETIEFELTVPTASEAKGEKYRTRLSIPAYISEDLQKEVDGQEIVWSCVPEGLIASDGKVTRPSKDTDATVTATIADAEITKNVKVMAEGGQVLSYVIQGGNLYENTGDLLASSDSRRSDALFLATKTTEEESYTELNKGKAVVYVKWDGDQKSNPDNQMGSPILFRKADGSLAAAASGNNNKNGIYVWDTQNNMAFANERFLTLADAGTKVQNPSVIYDSMSGGYKIFWQDQNDKTYVSLMTDLKNGTVPEQTVETVYNKEIVSGVLPSNAVKNEASVFEASASEYEAIIKKYGNVYNTEVETVNIEAKPGESVELPETVKASYSDGSTKNLGVVWDEEELKALDSGKEGVYEVTGTVQQDAYTYPFIEERADPHVFYNEDDGYYYATGSYYEENMTAPSCAQSYRKLDIRRAKTIEGLKTAKEHYILESETGDRWGGFIWAPEFHKINGTWYCLVGAHDFGTSGVPANINWNSAH